MHHICVCVHVWEALLPDIEPKNDNVWGQQEVFLKL